MDDSRHSQNNRKSSNSREREFPKFGESPISSNSSSRKRVDKSGYVATETSFAPPPNRADLFDNYKGRSRSNSSRSRSRSPDEGRNDRKDRRNYSGGGNQRGRQRSFSVDLF